MISAWDVYLVMQLDSIRAALFVICGLGVTSALFVAGPMAGIADWDEKKSMRRKSTRALIACVVGLLFGAVIPSSKTAAAMILVPKLTSPEVVQPLSKEAGELYGLAKEALRNLAEDRPADKHERE